MLFSSCFQVDKKTKAMLTEQRTSTKPCKHFKKNKKKKLAKTLKRQSLNTTSTLKRPTRNKAERVFLRGCRRRQPEAYVLGFFFSRVGMWVGGAGNLTLSPQVSRFFQTRLRLWGAWEDQTRRRTKKETKKRCRLCIWNSDLKCFKKKPPPKPPKKRKKKWKALPSSEDLKQKKKRSD